MMGNQTVTADDMFSRFDTIAVCDGRQTDNGLPNHYFTRE